MSGTEKTTVAVVGSGLTGLLVAQGLKQRGIPVVVLERDPSLDFRARDWTILVHWAMPIFQKLLPPDIIADLPRASCNPHLDFTPEVECLPVWSGITDGELLFSSPTPGARRINRQELRRLLTRGVDIRWGKRVKGLAEGEDGRVKLEFEGGEGGEGGMEAEFILGADGTASTVRELLVGAERAQPKLSGFMFATGIVRYGDKAKVDAIVDKHPVAATCMGAPTVSAVGVMYVDDPQDTTNWTTFWVRIWKGESFSGRGQKALDYIREKVPPAVGIFQRAVDWTASDSERVTVDEMKYWIPGQEGEEEEATTWDNWGGRVTLAGDAAHPMLPFRGQGLQNAIVDADLYVESVSKLVPGRDTDSPAAANHDESEQTRARVMAEYDGEMMARGAKAVKSSLQEAAKSLDVETVKKMVMATKGHGQGHE